ncbi:hypothetical protein AX16_006590 [Volvariella volvacea WC 439]|nr:hypothetical protein AX16_006590 [Volvariella volvacea WC 439]
MSDGPKLRQAWHTALNDAETHFRQLLTSYSSSDWKRLANPGDPSTSKKGKARAVAVPETADVVVHRKSSKSGEEIYRLVLDVNTGDDPVSLEPWKAVLATPELRQEWDPAVEEAHLVEMFDQTTRISKTNFTLGWPANPRDAVTISRSIHDASTLIDISTSLPRSADDPAYLRPSPPYVRSHVTLFAWCIQHVQPPPFTQPPITQRGDIPKRRNSSGSRVRITCFWQHDLKAIWNFGFSASLVQQLSTMTVGLLKTVMKRGNRVPRFIGYGNGVSVERVRFQVGREALTLDYSIIPEEDVHRLPGEHVQVMDEVHALREQRRLTRSIECLLPSLEGWDVQVSTKASSEAVEQLPWSAHAYQSSSYSSASQHSTSQPDQIILRFTHSALIDDHSVLKVRVIIEVSGSSGLRLNGLPQTIHGAEERDPSAQYIPQQILQDVSSAADLSFHTTSSISTATSTASTSTPTLVRRNTERSAAAEKSVLSRVRRNYIYFSSLLQEPEAKWRRTTDARGVAITQLDSIDPTLVVYRAEATFVGVGLWDLYGAVVSPGTRSYWDKQHEDAVLLEDVNELTELWHYKTKPAWPVNGRDSVVLKTVYKSPTTIHVFSFSADDPHLFPNIPPAEPNVIRTQVDLQGWAIEALSPTTTLLTLLEQSDPKGWTNKTSIPTQMINTLAGIGEYAIKFGGPPVLTRLTGGKVNDMKYDHEKTSFRVEYEVSASRRANAAAAAAAAAIASGSAESNIRRNASDQPVIECEIRCDIDSWAPSLDVVIDPPPQTISCLRRHKLSPEGGGLWLTFTHDALFVDDDRVLVIVRRAPGKEKGLVMVNGAKTQVDVEELSEQEIQALKVQKRVKPPRIPLDQPPVVGAIKKRRAEWDADSNESSTPIQGNGNGSGAAANSGWASAPQISSPLARFFTNAVDQVTTTTQSAMAAISPASAYSNGAVPTASRLPMQYALEALAWTQEVHGWTSTEGWTLAGDKGLQIHRKLIPGISPVIHVHKGSKVIEGISAEELASIITESDCRKKWDDRFDSETVLESFGGQAKTSFLVARTGFPFRDRGFYLASVVARSHVPASLSRRGISTAVGEVAEQSNGARNAVFCVSASFSPDSVTPPFSSNKINPYVLPIGRVYVDAWILETLDPYTKENYAIPSARCTRLVAVDFAGSIPAAMNSGINTTLPRAVLAVEAYVKGISPLPITRLPTPAMVITDKKVEEGFLPISWKLRKRDEQRVLVNSKFTAEDRVYRTTIFIRNPFHSPATRPDQATPRSSGIVHNSLKSREGRSSSLGIDGLPTPTPSLFHTSQSVSPTGTATIGPRRETSPIGRQQRHRAASAASLMTQQQQHPYPVSPPGTMRGRATSSAFTVKGEVRPSTDFLVGEIVIDSKLYPEGYSVSLKSWLRSGALKERSGKIGASAVAGKLPLLSLSSPNAKSSSASSAVNAAKQNGAADNANSAALPLGYTIHTMPSSPLHSSSLNAEGPTRHLLRLTLPTAQYQISTVRDPLTGEMQSAPPMPDWLLQLLPDWHNDESSAPSSSASPAPSTSSSPVQSLPWAGGAIVEVEIRPESGAKVGNSTSQGSTKGGVVSMVTIDGKEVAVLNDKESLTSLGREELLDDRVSRMAILSRMPNEAEPLPEELKTSLAIADELLDPAATTGLSSINNGQDAVNMNGKGAVSPQDSVSSEGTVGANKNAEERSPSKESTELPQTTDTPPTPHANHAASPGLLWFWNDYSNPLTRRKINGASTAGTTASEKNAKTDESASPSPELPGGLGNSETATQIKTTGAAERRGLYPISTLVVVALIAFLIGSLLRSLLSPADFIYVVKDLQEAEEANSGWREIKRLVEIKYLVGGWDFQIAVVRRP